MDDETAVPGFLDDYAFTIWGLIELYQATLEPEYLATALDLNYKSIEIFYDDDEGAFYFTREESELPLRKKEMYDGAIPSGNSVMMLNLIKLARLTGRNELEEMALKVSEHYAEQINLHPLSHVQTLIAFGTVIWPSLEIVITGEPGHSTTNAMLQVITNSRLLDVNVILRSRVAASLITKLVPFTKNLPTTQDKAHAYICKGHECKMPITDATVLDQQLREFIKKRSRD
jgi:uncharacterized protein YyaL (SSP411 family)